MPSGINHIQEKMSLGVSLAVSTVAVHLADMGIKISNNYNWTTPCIYNILEPAKIFLINIRELSVVGKYAPMMLILAEFDTVSWTATILSKSIGTLFMDSELFQMIPTPPHPLVKDDPSCSLESKHPMPLKPGARESSLESS